MNKFNKKTGKKRCANCAAELSGAPEKRVKNKTKRVSSRPYAGVLCSKCARYELRKRAYNRSVKQL